MPTAHSHSLPSQAEEEDEPAGGESDPDMVLSQAELSSLPETVEVFTHNRSFVGVLFLRMYLTARGR